MQSPIRIVHTADLHLGSPFRAFPEQAARLREEQLAGLSRLTAFCAERQVQILLIAGDLFDQPLPAPQLVRTVAELLETIPDTAVFIVAGNHDPAFIDSPYRSQPWPANVHCFTDSLCAIELAGLPARIHGAGFTATASTRSLLPEWPRPASLDRLNLLVLHGDLVSRGQGSAYNPVSLDQLCRFGMDYTAMGHRHEATSLMPAAQGHVAYSGCPLGRGFDETGPKSIRLIDCTWHEASQRGAAAAWHIATETICLGGRTFWERAVDAGSCASHEEVIDRILASLSADGQASWTDHLYRIVLKGEPDDAFTIAPSLLLQRLARAAFHIEVVDETTARLDLAALARENGLRGTFVRQLSERLAEAERLGRPDEAMLARRALALGLASFSGEVALHANL